MSCNYKEGLEAYAAGIVDGKEQWEIEEHLQSCAQCRAALAQHQQAIRMLSDAFNEEAPSWLTQKTLSVLKARSKRSSSWFIWGLPALAGAAVVVALLVIGPDVKSRFGTPQSIAHLSATAKVSHAAIADEFDLNLDNPVNDRSIYDDLGIATHVAKLLL